MKPHPLRARRIAGSVAIFVLVVGHTTGNPSSRASEPATIAWRDDYGSALAEAADTNRLLWVQFTGPWCPNCTRMEQDSFPHPAIVEHARASFVPLKLRSDVHEQLALSFNLRALPATIIVAPDREIVSIHEGYLGPDEFDAFLRDSLALRATRSPHASGSPKPAREPSAPDAKPQPPRPAAPAVSGYCPVSLVRARKLVRGNAQFVVFHQGRVYHLASDEMVAHFREAPERYVPANDGACPVEQVDKKTAKPGSPQWGVLYRGRLYLCSSAENRRLFFNEPDRYTVVDR